MSGLSSPLPVFSYGTKTLIVTVIVSFRLRTPLQGGRSADWAARQTIQIDSALQPRQITSEPEVWKIVVAASAAADVEEACRQSKRWLNPERRGRPYVQDLFDHAAAFVRAKKQNVYYPRRPSGDEQRVIFFARAMAGISLGLSPNTGIDRLRKIKHGGKCPCIHCDSKRWDRIQREVYKLGL